MWFIRPKRFSSIDKAEQVSRQVRDLFLKHLDLDQYANRITQFTRLRCLSIGWCCNRELPTSILSLQLLKSLTVLNTPLRTFPTWLAELPHLQTLVLRGTDLREIPSAIKNFTQLREFDFSNNDIHSVPAELRELKELRILALGDSQLASLPDEVLSLRRLQSLRLAGTNFSAAEASRVKTHVPRASVWPAIYVRLPRLLDEH